MLKFVKKSVLETSPDALFDWHMREGAFERLAPPWQDVRIVERNGKPSESGSQVVLSVPLGPVRRRWVAEHRDIDPGRSFRDVQVEGPFRHWEHTHRFLGKGTGSVLEDEIHLALPLGRVGELFGSSAARRSLERVFRYRHETTARDLETHARYRALPRLRILMTGSRGLVGSTLRSFLTTGRHDVVPVFHRSPQDENDFEGIDAVVHLAGESIASGRWTTARKERIRESRRRGTRALAESLARLPRKPRVLVSASAVGYYGDRGAEILDETSQSGSGFLAGVCREWEAATEPAREAGIRVVHLRTGIVLSPKGGALQRMLVPLRLGLGGVLGSGEQYLSWITIDDLAGVVLHALANETLEGPVNAVSPRPMTNRELTQTLARVLERPARLPAPAFALRAALGEMAQELLLASARVAPGKLLETGYRFRYPELEGALRHMLGRSTGH